MSIETKSDRWISLTQSVVLHGLVVGALAYGFYAYKKQPKPVQPTLAVEASVVDSSGAPAVQPTPTPPPPAPEPEPEPPPPEEQGPPAPSPEEVQQREEAERQEQETQLREEQERVALQRQQAEEKAAAEQKQREEEAERKRRQEQREAEEKRLAEAKRQADEKRRADEARRRAEQARRDAALRESLEAEERAMALRSSGALANWLGQIANRVQRAWIRPPNAQPGVQCWVYVTQTPGGEVTNVRIGECNGDAALRESIESAVYRASPLPAAPDPSLFDRNLSFLFKPTD